jgi:hypothetical protein
LRFFAHPPGHPQQDDRARWPRPPPHSQTATFSSAPTRPATPRPTTKQRYLPAAKVGGVWVTTRSRLREFFDGKMAVAAETSVPATPSKALTPKRGKKHQHTEPAPK